MREAEPFKRFRKRNLSVSLGSQAIINKSQIKAKIKKVRLGDSVDRTTITKSRIEQQAPNHVGFDTPPRPQINNIANR